MGQYSNLIAAIQKAIMAANKDKLPVIAIQLMQVRDINTQEDLARFDTRLETVARILQLRRLNPRGSLPRALKKVARAVREARFL